MYSNSAIKKYREINKKAYSLLENATEKNLVSFIEMKMCLNPSRGCLPNVETYGITDDDVYDFYILSILRAYMETVKIADKLGRNVMPMVDLIIDEAYISMVVEVSEAIEAMDDAENAIKIIGDYYRISTDGIGVFPMMNVIMHLYETSYDEGKRFMATTKDVVELLVDSKLGFTLDLEGHDTAVTWDHGHVNMFPFVMEVSSSIKGISPPLKAIFGNNHSCIWKHLKFLEDDWSLIRGGYDDEF